MQPQPKVCESQRNPRVPCLSLATWECVGSATLGRMGELVAQSREHTPALRQRETVQADMRATTVSRGFSVTLTIGWSHGHSKILEGHCGKSWGIHGDPAGSAWPTTICHVLVDVPS